jgi:hypothetical protein
VRAARRLGNPIKTLDATKLGREVQSAASDHFVRELMPFLIAMRAVGITSQDHDESA